MKNTYEFIEYANKLGCDCKLWRDGDLWLTTPRNKIVRIKAIATGKLGIMYMMTFVAADQDSWVVYKNGLHQVLDTIYQWVRL